MEDTSREVRLIQHDLWMALTPGERARLMGQLFALAQRQTAARAPAGLSPIEMKRFLIREMYGIDLPDSARLPQG